MAFGFLSAFPVSLLVGLPCPLASAERAGVVGEQGGGVFPRNMALGVQNSAE